MSRVVPILLGLSVAGFSGQGMAGSVFGGAQKRGNIMVEPPRQRGSFLAAGIAAAFAGWSPAALIPESRFTRSPQKSARAR
jgi:hypothetical protein